MSEVGDFIEFLFKVKQIDLQEKEIAAKEEQARLAGHIFQGIIPHQATIAESLKAQLEINKQLLESQISNSKQTLEIIKLTRNLQWLTVALLLLAVVQVVILVFKP